MDKDFVVEYSPSWCHIEDISIQPCETLEQYKEGFKKHKYSCPDAIFGDFFHWNNSGWAIVRAKNASDALKKYILVMIWHDSIGSKDKTVIFFDEFITESLTESEDKNNG